MDPQACLGRWRLATARGDRTEALEARQDLTDWLRRGGFWPTGLFPSELTCLRQQGLTTPADYDTIQCSECGNPGPHEHNGQLGLHREFLCECGYSFNYYPEIPSHE